MQVIAIPRGLPGADAWHIIFVTEEPHRLKPESLLQDYSDRQTDSPAREG